MYQGTGARDAAWKTFARDRDDQTLQIKETLEAVENLSHMHLEVIFDLCCNAEQSM